MHVKVQEFSELVVILIYYFDLGQVSFAVIFRDVFLLVENQSAPFLLPLLHLLCCIDDLTIGAFT